MKVDVAAFIDAHPVSMRQWLVGLLCLVILAIDGFDTGAVGFMVPSLRTAFHATPGQLAPLLAGGFAGLFIGSLLAGPAADRWGRKPVLLVSLVVFGSATLLAAAAHSIDVLIVLRVVTGVGLGGAFPTAVTLASEFCPMPRRSTLTTIAVSGFTLGSAASGVVASFVIPDHGWRWMFVIGGSAPLLMAALCAFVLLESPRFLMVRNGDDGRARAILRHIGPVPADAAFVATQADRTAKPLAMLFRRDLRVGTGALWLAFFVSLLVVYLTSGWLPLLLVDRQFSPGTVPLVVSAFQVGGTIGGIAIGFLMDRFDPRDVLAATYLGGAAAIALVGAIAGMGPVAVALLVGVAGILVSGSQTGLNAMAARFYPVEMRATGVSCCTSIGRLGAILGSMLGGTLLGWGVAFPQIFGMLGGATIVASLSMLAFRRWGVGSPG